MAPELHSASINTRTGYIGFPVDNFALGVILFLMSSRTFPALIETKNDDSLFKYFYKNKYEKF